MKSIKFSLKATNISDAELTLGSQEKRDEHASILNPRESESGCSSVEFDARDICYRGSGFPNNTLSGESGDYVAFEYDVNMTLDQNTSEILKKNPDLEFPAADAWWPMIAGKNDDDTHQLQGWYLINPSNPPREKVEGFGDYRFAVLVYRTPGQYHVVKPAWFLSSIGADKEGRVIHPGRSLIYFKVKAPMSQWKKNMGCYFALTGKHYRKGGQKELELTDYGKSVIANVSTLNLQPREITSEGIQDATERVIKALGNNFVSRKTFNMLVTFTAARTIGNQLSVIGPDTVATFQADFDWSGKGGSNYYSRLDVWHCGEHKQERWQWRDGRSDSGDRPHLRISKIIPSKSEIDGNKVKFCLGGRFVTYTFEDPQWQKKNEEELVDELFLITEKNKLFKRLLKFFVSLYR